MTTIEGTAGAGLRRGLLARPELLALVAITGLAATVRFAALGGQSLWLDEWLTHGYTELGLRDLGSVLWNYEPHPPLYFASVWSWTQVFGNDEAGLRSLSALFGSASVPVAYAAARTRFPTRVAL